MIIEILKLIRPQTLIAAILPIMVSYKFASQHYAIKNNVLPSLLLVGIFIQIATNIFNDYYDGIKGVDVDRIGPKRANDKKIISSKFVFSLGILSLVLSFLSALPIISINLIYIPIGIICLYLTYGYTGGPFPLAYKGLGEVFVYIFFGFVIFLGSFYALVERIVPTLIPLASTFGSLSILLIYSNNFRDRVNDEKFNKRTIAVRFARYSTQIFYFFLILDLCHKLFLMNLFSYKIICTALIDLFILYNIKRHRDIFVFKLCILNLLITSVFIYASI